jgi:calcium-translocating P-type ATPase
VICSDKTGTLTRAEMTIERVVTASGVTRITGVGYEPRGTVEPLDPAAAAALRAEDIVVLSGGSLASNARLHRGADGSWEAQGDPTEIAFLVAERKLGVDERRARRFERVGEIPFSSERKMMSSIEIDREHGGERVLITKGAPDVLLRRCTRLRRGMEVLPLDDAWRARMLAGVDALTGDALRTLAVAYRPLEPGEHGSLDAALERDLIFVGTVGMIDPPRAEAAAAIRQARRAGIRVVMITGDHPRTAARIAADLGIVERGAVALSGTELDALDAAQLRAAVRTTSVYARVAPVHKMRIVDALQADGHVVAMTGDGVNDAPALKAADIGIAMGITGTEVSKEAAKMILADDNFATIVAAVREGRRIFSNIRKFLRYLLSSNMGEVLTVFCGVVGAGVLGLADAGGTMVLPLLATQILWINLIPDSAPAVAMGVDPETEDVMARRPRKPGERVIDARMWAGVLEVGVVMAAASLLTIDCYLPGGMIEGDRSLANARTAGFTVLVFAQLFNCLNARSDRVSALRHLFSNRWLWGAIALSALLQVAVVHVDFLNTAFGTEPLAPSQWLACVAMGSTVLWVGELRKLAWRIAERRVPALRP